MILKILMKNVHLNLRLLLVGITAALFFASTAKGQEAEELKSDLIHSDLPLFGSEGDNEWPQHFYDNDSFGCTSRVAFGDWIFKEQTVVADDNVEWYRFSNYGVFHCFANIYHANERKDLDNTDPHPSFFVDLGSIKADGKPIEIWAIQIGARPGSDFLLLSRSPTDGLIESFNVLQTECPRANVRDAKSLDILLTRYCAINSRRELIRFAHRMVKLPPLGTLILVPEKDDAGKSASK